MNSNSQTQITAPQVEAKILAEALPVSKTSKTGLLSETFMPLKLFREKFGLANAEAKRLHAKHRATWSTQQNLSVCAAIGEGGFNVQRVSRRNGRNGETVNVRLFKQASTRGESKAMTIARLEAQVAELSKKLASK